MRGITAAASAALLSLIAVAVAEVALLAMLLLFSVILHLNLTIAAGPAMIASYVPSNFGSPQVTVYNGAIVASILATAGCGAASAIWSFRRWRPKA
jgi:hypothetical protein